jgi:hypothetical protein
MMSENDPKAVTTPSSGAASKDAKSSDLKRELSDEEIAGIDGGVGGPAPPIPTGGPLPPTLPPVGPPGGGRITP